MDNASANIPGIVSYTTYYHSPVGLLKISGTENYISEVSFFDKPKSRKAERKIYLH
jgi:methylated-DNA-[protein]-cysteine S-methyltransferase